MVPVAPTRFSVTTLTFQRSASFGPNARARISAPVPGVYATTNCTVRVGHVCPELVEGSCAAALQLPQTAARPTNAGARRRKLRELFGMRVIWSLIGP